MTGVRSDGRRRQAEMKPVAECLCDRLMVTYKSSRRWRQAKGQEASS